MQESLTVSGLVVADKGYDYQGQHYEDLTEALHCGVLGFCACGAPEENLTFILGALELISQQCPDDIPWSTWWEENQAKKAAYFGNDGAAYFFYYCADKAELTEHGGSVPGWLTEKGEELLTLLRHWKTTIQQDD